MVILKTIEEKAKEHQELKYPHTIGRGMAKDLQECYNAGYTEANKWISVEEELPKEGIVVLTKVDCHNKHGINYQVAAYIKQANYWLTSVHSAIGFPKCMESVDDYIPTHWRPIN